MLGNEDKVSLEQLLLIKSFGVMKVTDLHKNVHTRK